MKKVSFKRNLNLNQQIVVLDGLTGSGKTMLGPLISSFNRIQTGRFEYIFEYLSIAHYFNKIEDDAMNTIFKLQADIKLYDGMISREVNLRPSDLSSIFKGGKTIKYLKQLFKKDGAAVVPRLEKERPILFLIMHQSLSCIQGMFDTFKEKLFVIEIIRHPIYLLDQWDSYIKNYGTNPRDFSMWISYENQNLPWFTKGIEKEYSETKGYDRIIYAINNLYENIFETIQNPGKKKIIFIPFEQFVIEPFQFIKKIEVFLDSTHTKKTLRILKKENLPRNSINDIPQRNIYKRYGLTGYNSKISDEQHYNDLMNKIKGKCLNKTFKILTDLSNKYEKEYGKWF